MHVFPALPCYGVVMAERYQTSYDICVKIGVKTKGTAWTVFEPKTKIPSQVDKHGKVTHGFEYIPKKTEDTDVSPPPLFNSNRTEDLIDRVTYLIATQHGIGRVQHEES